MATNATLYDLAVQLADVERQPHVEVDGRTFTTTVAVYRLREPS